jgi:hypothetical protein
VVPVEHNKTHLEPGDEPPPDDQFIPIPEAHYAAMGKVADAWADLEFEIDRLIWYLLGTNQAFGACVTAQMISIHPRLQALRALTELWEISKPIIDELGTFDGKAVGLAETRNRLIHDKRLIQWKTKEVVRFQVSARRKLKFGVEPESIASLDAFREKVQNLMETFTVISHKIRIEIEASSEKQRKPLPHILRSADPI